MSILGFPVDKEAFSTPSFPIHYHYSNDSGTRHLDLVVLRTKDRAYYVSAHIAKGKEIKSLTGVVRLCSRGITTINGVCGGNFRYSDGKPSEYGYGDIQDIFWNVEEAKENSWGTIFGYSIEYMKISHHCRKRGGIFGVKEHWGGSICMELGDFKARIEPRNYRKKEEDEDTNLVFVKIFIAGMLIVSSTSLYKDEKWVEYLDEYKNRIRYYIPKTDECDIETEENRKAIDMLIKRSGVLDLD